MCKYIIVHVRIGRNIAKKAVFLIFFQKDEKILQNGLYMWKSLCYNKIIKHSLS